MSLKPMAVALILVSGGPTLLAQDSPAASAVLAREREWAEALVKADVDTLDRLYAADLVYVHSGGNVETKTQFLDRVRQGGLKYQNVELVEPRVRVYGPA